jgi:hypothetical protein
MTGRTQLCEDQDAAYFRKKKKQMQSLQMAKTAAFLWNSKKANWTEAD